MSTLEIVFGIILLLFCLSIILVVLLQEAPQQQPGAVGGSADTFLEKNKSRTVDAFLARWTRIIAIGVALMVIAINVVSFLNSK